MALWDSAHKNKFYVVPLTLLQNKGINRSDLEYTHNHIIKIHGNDTNENETTILSMNCCSKKLKA